MSITSTQERTYMRCQPVTTVREPFSSQIPSSPKIRSMNSVSFAMLKAEKAGFSKHLNPCVKKIPWLLMLLCDSFQESCRYQESCCCSVQARMSRALHNFCCAGRTSTCASSMSCQSCQLMGHSSSPVHADRHTEERAQMQVSDSDHCERTILFPDQRRVSPSQC